MKAKKKRLEMAVGKLIADADSLCKKAEQKSDFALLIEANALRDASKRSQSEIDL